METSDRDNRYKSRERMQRLRERRREGRIAILIELDEINAAEWLKLRGDPDRQALQDAMQAFADREINEV
jgi:hypothetical protein